MSLFRFPDIEIDRRETPLLVTPLPTDRDEGLAIELGRRLGIEGRAENLGTTVVVRDDRAALEVFVPSESVRYSRGQSAASEMNGAVAVPDREGAIESADRFIAEHGDLFGIEGTEPSEITESELLRLNVGEREPESHVVALHVNWRYTVAGLPIVGPGAKAQVTIGNGGEVTDAYRFWRKTDEAGVMAVISPDEAIDRFQRDSAYSELDPKTCSVTVKHGRLAYYAIPPRETQNYLLPVYAFEGTVSTPYLERYDFTRYVVAVSVKTRQAKAGGAVNQAPVPVF